MTEPNWTPGPWGADAINSWNVWSKDCKIVESSPESIRQGPTYRIPGREERIANARLIAAAPDFADIALRVQHLANERGGDYSSLTHDELASFMVEYDDALAKALPSTVNEEKVDG